MILQSVIDHRAVEGSISTLVRAVSHHLQPFLAECQSILIQLSGTEDVHLQMEPFFTTLIGYHQHGIAVSILLGKIIQTQMFALGIGS